MLHCGRRVGGSGDAPPGHGEPRLLSSDQNQKFMGCEVPSEHSKKKNSHSRAKSPITGSCCTEAIFICALVVVRAYFSEIEVEYGFHMKT